MSIFKSIKDALNPSLSTMMAKAVAKTDKEDEKIKKKGKKLVLRDMGSEGRTWKFYLAKADGTYTKAMTYNEVKPLYTQENLLTPEIANAIVTTETGFVVRRGLQDFYRQGIRLNKRDMKVLPPYRIPFDDPEAEKRATHNPADDKLWEEVFGESSTVSDDSSKATTHRTSTKQTGIDNDEDIAVFEDDDIVEDYPNSSTSDSKQSEKKHSRVYEIENGVLIKYRGTAARAVIPDDVEEIGERAFENNKKLTTVVIPETVKKIGMFAFSGCSNLSSVQIPDSVTSIEPMTFYMCSSLGKIDIPKNVTSIGDMAFNECVNLFHLTIPNGVKIIGMAAFASTDIRSIEMPDSVTSVGSLAFANCEKLTSIKISKNLEQWGNEVVSGDHQLSNIDYFGNNKNVIEAFSQTDDNLDTESLRLEEDMSDPYSYSSPYSFTPSYTSTGSYEHDGYTKVQAEAAKTQAEEARKQTELAKRQMEESRRQAQRAEQEARERRLEEDRRRRQKEEAERREIQRQKEEALRRERNRRYHGVIYFKGGRTQTTGSSNDRRAAERMAQQMYDQAMRTAISDHFKPTRYEVVED